MDINEIEQKFEKYKKHWKWGLFALVLVFIVPIYFVLKTLMFAGAAAVACVVLAMGTTAGLPVLSTKLSNWQLKALRKEAQENPVETLMRELKMMGDDIDRYKAETDQRGAMGRAHSDRVAELRKTDPEGADEFKEEIQEFEAEMADRLHNLSVAVKNFEDFKEFVTKKKNRWDVAVQSAEFRKSTPKEKDLAMRKMFVDDATEAIRHKANVARAQLATDAAVAKARREHAADKLSQGKTRNTQTVANAIGIENNPTDVIDIPSVNVKEVIRK